MQRGHIDSGSVPHLQARCELCAGHDLPCHCAYPDSGQVQSIRHLLQPDREQLILPQALHLLVLLFDLLLPII